VARIALAFLLAGCRSAFALNPSLDINQYGHSAWTIREGFFKGMIYSIAQTTDGYLWLGTEFGLLRFDGVRLAPWTPPGIERLPSDWIYHLLTSRDGTLWIGTRAGLASWRDGKLTRYLEMAGYPVLSLIEDRDGTVWTGQAGGGVLCAIRNGKAQCYGRDGGMGPGILSLLEDGTGNLWGGGMSRLWRWKPSPPKAIGMPPVLASDLNATDDGQLLIATNGGLMRLTHGKVEPYPIRGAPKSYIPYRLLRDRDGSLWIGTSGGGLLHLHQDRTDAFSRSDGLSGDNILSLFEDREHNIWVATYGGLDRFRELPVFTISSKQGLSSDAPGCVLAAKDGSVWVGGMHGLDRWKNGQVTTFRKTDGLPDGATLSLFEDGSDRIWASSAHGLAYWEDGRFIPVREMAGRATHFMKGDNTGNLWISEEHALLHLSDGRIVEHVPWSRFGIEESAIDLLADDEGGGVWLGFRTGGSVFHFKDGQVRASYTPSQGLGGGAVADLRRGRDGTLWAATEGGLSAIRGERIDTLTSRNGLPCESVYWSISDDDRSMWLYMPCGLVRIARAEIDAWLKDPKRRILSTVFDGSDGVRTHAFSGYVGPRVAKSTDGKIWFVSFDGISVFDPQHLPVNKLAPPVHIESIKADDKSYELRRGMGLPAKVRDVRIEYTALSLAAPEKVHFKYMLDGQDRVWAEVVNERQVKYTNLPPRQYRFRVMASNNSGVWNETGDTLEFSIAPAWNQTSWFYASCVAAFLAMLWGLYRLRLYQIRREFNAQLDGRVGERLRVARELHDTLLQSFQASLIRMQAARNVFARRPEKAVESLDAAITMAAGAVAEGRSAIQNLRAEPAGGGDLAQLLTAAGQELAHSEEAQGNPPVFRLTVEGERRDLEPLLQDEVYRIARELLRNAFRHAQAGQIEAEIRYESRQLRAHVRDDGKGIDPEVLKAGGRTGHWGLPGMRERVDRFGGKLEFWSEAGAGTEAVLTVPAAAAYGASNGGAFSFLRGKKARS